MQRKRVNLVNIILCNAIKTNKTNDYVLTIINTTFKLCDSHTVHKEYRDITRH